MLSTAPTKSPSRRTRARSTPADFVIVRIELLLCVFYLITCTVLPLRRPSGFTVFGLNAWCFLASGAKRAL